MWLINLVENLLIGYPDRKWDDESDDAVQNLMDEVITGGAPAREPQKLRSMISA